MNNKLRENYINLKIASKKLYLSINIDKYIASEDLLDKIAASVSAGIDIVELTTNNYPNKLLEISTQVKQLHSIFDFTLIIKDRADIATLIEADGISLTSNSINTNFVRQILGDNSIIGCYDFSQSNCDFCICSKESNESTIPLFVRYNSANNSQRYFLDETIFDNNDFIQFIQKLKITPKF